MKAKLALFVGGFCLWTLATDASAANRILTNKFERADANRDGQLVLDEFLATQGGTTRFTDARHRFRVADVDDSDSLSLVEFLASRGGKEGGKPNRRETFDLADLDEDGFLDPEEFSGTEPNGKNWPQLWKKFNRLDKDEDVLISRDEWQRNGVIIIPI